MIPGKSPDQIRSHFDACYVEATPEPRLRPPAAASRPHRFVPSACPLPFFAPLDNPPRLHPRPQTTECYCSGETVGSLRELPDYYAARGEFRVEYDDSAERETNFVARFPCEETLLWPSRNSGRKGQDDEVAELLRDLAVAVFEACNRRLARRAAVRRLVREQGLISRRRATMADARYRGVRCAPLSWDGLRRVGRLLDGEGDQMGRLMESLLLESDIKCNILTLQKRRTDGK